MSTEIVALEKIDLHHGDKNADMIRLHLVKYLNQFLELTGVFSIDVYEFAIQFEDTLISYVNGTTKEDESHRYDFKWKKEIAKYRTSDIIDMILDDADVTVILSYKVEYNPSKSQFGKEYWNYILQECLSKDVNYRSLEYDNEAHISMLHFEKGVFTDSPAPVSKDKVADIPNWYCCNFEVHLKTEDVFNGGQLRRLEGAINYVRTLFCGRNRSIDDVACLENDCLDIFNEIRVPKEALPQLLDFLNVVKKVANEHGKSLHVTAEFVSDYFEEFAAMKIEFKDEKAVSLYFRY